MQDDVGARRLARSHWPITVSRLGNDEPTADRTTPEQRIGMMWELVVQAWAVAGLEIPDYDRAHTPICVRRRDQQQDE